MKLAKIVDLRLHEALNKLATERLPIKTAFKLKGIAKIINEEFVKYEEVRKSGLTTHGLKNEDGSLKLDERGVVQFTEEGIEAFSKEMNELVSIDLDIPTLTLSELGNNVEISATELELLSDIIVEA